MGKTLRNKIDILVYIILIIIFSVIVTLSNLGLEKNYIGMDSGVGYNFPKTFYKLIYYTWDSFQAPGKINVTSMFNFLWTNFLFVFFKLGLSGILIERLTFFMFFATSGIGMFFLLSLFQKNNLGQKKVLNFGVFVGSLLYMFNHFTMWMVSFPIIPYHLTYMLFPWIMGLFVLNTQFKNSFLTIFIFSVVCLFLISSQPSNTLSIILFLIFYSLFFIKEIIKNSISIRFLIISTVLILLFSGFIYLPIIGTRSNPYGNISTTDNFLGSLYLNSFLTSLPNLLLTAGVVTWAVSPYYDLYKQNDFFILLGFSIPVLVILSLFSQKSRKIKFFFVVIIIFSLFLAKGTKPPLEELFLSLYSKIRFLAIFRAVYPKFAYFIVFSYAVLISFSVIQIYYLISRRYKLISYFILLIPLIICLYGLPFFMGQLPQKDFLSTIPKEYKLLAKELDTDLSDFKVLSLPPAPSGSGLILQWGKESKFIGPHPDAFFLDEHVLDSYWFIDKGFQKLAKDDSWRGSKFEKNISNFLNFSNILNIKYLLLHRDFVESYNFAPSNIPVKLDGQLKTRTLMSILETQPGIEVIENNSYFSLYRLPDKYFYPHFYTPMKIIYSDDQMKTLFDQTNSPNFMDRYAILSRNNQIQIENIPQIIFVRMNPTKYRIQVRNANGQFLLVFSESFNKNWKLYLSKKRNNELYSETTASYFEGEIKEGKHKDIFLDFSSFETWFKKPLDEKNHLLVNGYANSWIINPSEICESKLTGSSVNGLCTKNADGSFDFELVVEFWPQRLFYIGLAISGITLFGCLGYLMYDWRRKTIKI